jgi:proline iminopeptidase
MMVEFKMYCPQAEFVMFEESGHNPQVEEHTATIALIRKFLNK